MPYKYNESRRHKFEKAKYKVQNWREYNEALRQRGNITYWFSEEAIEQWQPSLDDYSGRGRPQMYSDVAIETGIVIRQVYNLPLRQTQGFLNSLATLMNLDIPIPDYSTLSKRSDNLKLKKLTDTIQPGSHVIVDSTGLKVYGRDEWHQEKHKVLGRRTWRKLHLAIDEKHQIIACELTTNCEGDSTTVPDLLSQFEHDFDKFLGDGAYDGESIYDAVIKKQSDADVIIPPPKHAVINEQNNSQRNDHIKKIEEHGRINWQKETGYGLRSYVELAIQRYKRIIGNKLKARILPRQKTEAQVSVRVLNRMTQLGMPITIRVA